MSTLNTLDGLTDPELQELRQTIQDNCPAGWHVVIDTTSEMTDGKGSTRFEFIWIGPGEPTSGQIAELQGSFPNARLD